MKPKYLSKVTQQGEPGLGPKSPDSLLKLKMFQDTVCSTTKHPLTHTCLPTPQPPQTHSFSKGHHPIGHGDLLSLPCLVEQLGPTPFTPSIRKACLEFPSNLPSGLLHTSSLSQSICRVGVSETPSVFPYLRARVELALTLEKRIRTHCPVAPPIIPPQTSVLAFAKTDPSKSPWPI